MIALGAGLGPGVRALEIGCGTGVFTEILARTGAHLVAIDISADLLVRARARGLPAESVEFLERGFEDCQSLGPFDAVVGSSVLHHLEVGIAIAKIRDVLKPRGIMCFTEPNMLNPQVLLQKNVPWIKAYLGDSPDETAFFRWGIRKLILEAGFEDVEVRPFDWVHPAIPAGFLPAMMRSGEFFETVPLIREFAGSLFIRAARP